MNTTELNKNNNKTKKKKNITESVFKIACQKKIKINLNRTRRLCKLANLVG